MEAAKPLREIVYELHPGGMYRIPTSTLPFPHGLSAPSIAGRLIGFDFEQGHNGTCSGRVKLLIGRKPIELIVDEETHFSRIPHKGTLKGLEDAPTYGATINGKRVVGYYKHRGLERIRLGD